MRKNSNHTVAFSRLRAVHEGSVQGHLTAHGRVHSIADPFNVPRSAIDAQTQRYAKYRATH